jgi:hypothetical protein
MRAEALAFGLVVTVGAVAGFAGCGSSIETTATGAGGNGGAATSTGTGPITTTNDASVGVGTGGTATVSSTAVTVSVSSTSSSGGPDPTCEAACMHAASCGSNVCTQYGITCNQVNAQLDCIAACIANTPCPISGSAALGCLEMCKGGSSSSSSSGFGSSSVAVGSSSSGMTGSTCQSCSVQSCSGSIGMCAANQTCLKWLECVQPCNQATPLDPACFAACDMQNAGASGLYGAVYSCACSSCATECGSIPECGATVDAGGPGVDAGP